jgi:hypothetical protein
MAVQPASAQKDSIPKSPGIDSLHTYRADADSIISHMYLNDTLLLNRIHERLATLPLDSIIAPDLILPKNRMYIPEIESQPFGQKPEKLVARSIPVDADSLILQCMMADSLWVAQTLEIIALNETDRLIPEMKNKAQEGLESLGYDPNQKDFMEFDVEYNAVDSMLFDLTTNEVKLYGNAYVKYGNITLTADRIVYDFDSYLVHAEGGIDSAGNPINEPVFQQGTESFEATDISYNFNSEKGFIKEVYSEASGAYVFAKKSKKQPNNHVHVKGGFFTTCDKEKPHYSFRTGKMIVIPDDKVVTGPGYLSVGKVPLPLGLPFIMLPNKNEQASGIIIPSYGDSQQQGFYLRDGGFYWAASDVFHTDLRGTIFTNGSWSLESRAFYNLRYKFKGGFSFRYNNMIFGREEIEDGNYSREKSYTINWTHQQDPKASKYSSFNARVNFVNGNQYRDDISTSTTNYVSQTFNSSLNYSYSIPNSPFTLAANARIDQNLNIGENEQRSVINEITLPQLTLNMNRIELPLSWLRKNSAGGKKWYERIGLTYNLNAENRVRFSPTVIDTVIITESNFREYYDFRNGIRQRASLNTNFSTKFFTLTPFVNVDNNIYTRFITKSLDPVTLETALDTINDLSAAWGVNTGVQLTTKLYGMYAFKGEGLVKAMRHQITFSANMSYNPGISPIVYGYTGEGGRFQSYSPYELEIFSPPNSRPSNTYSFRIINDLEAKVRKRTDSTQTYEKVKFIDNLSASASYDAFKDSIRWSNVAIAGRFTRLFNSLDVNYNLALDPYAYNLEGDKIADSFFNQTGKLIRIDRANIVASLRLKSSEKKTKAKPRSKAEKAVDDIQNEIESKIDNNSNETSFLDDFKIPWDLNLNYNLTVSRPIVWDLEGDKPVLLDTTNFIQTLSLRSSFTLFKIFRFTINSGFDFLNDQVLPTTVLGLYVDLHCWELSFSFRPLGRLQSYNVSFNIKSPLLKDLKIKRQDYFGSGRGFF